MNKVAQNLLQNVFGSPGETSNAILDSFLQAKNSYPLLNKQEIFKKVYLYRILAEQEVNQVYGLYDGNYQLLQEQRLIDISNGCIAYFTFLLMCVDSKIFFQNVAIHDETFRMVTKIIYDNAMIKAPKEIKNSYANFHELCDGGYKLIKYGTSNLDNKRNNENWYDKLKNLFER